MKNLKKVLALVMAFAMAFTMMAGAAYTDQADITAVDAVDTLTALGIMSGDPDGSFRPDDTITRAEAARIIYTIRSGGNSDASAYAGMQTTFTDVPSTAWYAGYVKHIQSVGIVSGKSATIFDPNAPVTGVEMSLMALRVMGYDPVKADIGGSTWSMKTIGYATEAGILEDVTPANGIHAALPREYAAQIMSNMLDAYTVRWSDDAGEYLNTNIVDADKKLPTVGSRYMGLSTIAGDILVQVSKEDNRDTFRVTTRDGDGDEYSYTRVEKDYSDLMGQAVKVMIKDGKTDKVYGIRADGDSKVVATGSVGTLGSVSNASRVKLNDVEYKLEATRANTAPIFANKGDSIASLSNLDTAITNKTANASSDIKLIDNNDDGKVDTVVITPKTVAKVTYVGTSSITAGITYKFSDADIYDGVARNDFAVIVDGDYTVTGDALITEAETLTAEVQGTRSGTTNEVRVNGIWYTLVAGVTLPTVGDTVDMAVVGNYVYDIDITAGSSKDILYISANDAAASDLGSDVTADARAYFADGTNKKITVSKVDGHDMSATAVASKVTVGASTVGTYAATDLAGKMFTYSVNKDGNYELRQMANSTGNAVLQMNGAVYSVNKNTVGYDSHSTSTTYTHPNNIATKPIADDAVVFVRSTVGGAEEVKVLTGKSVKDWASVAGTANGALIDEANGIDYVKVAVLQLAAAIPSASGDKSFAYLTSDAYQAKVDGTTVTAFPVWTGTEDTTLYEEGTANLSAAAGDVIAYVNDGDMIDVKTAGFTIAPYAIKGIEAKKNGLVSLRDTAGADTTVEMSDDVVFIKVDDSKNDGMEGNTVEAVTLAQFINGNYKLSAYVAIEGGEIIAIVFDEGGELDSGLYAQAYHTVTFTANGGTPAPANQSVLDGGKATAPAAMTKTDLTFAGWYKEAAFTNAVDWNDTITAPATYYAKWTATATFNLNGAVGTAVPDIIVTEGGVIATLPTPTINTYPTGTTTFTGWFTEAVGGTQFNNGDALSVNTILYAQYS